MGSTKNTFVVLHAWSPFLQTKLLSDGRIISFHEDNKLRMWNLQKPYREELENVLNFDAPIKILSILKDDTIVICDRLYIDLYHSYTGWIMTLEGHTDVTTCFISMNDRFITGSQDGTIKIWNQDVCIATLTDHTDGIIDILSLPDENFVSSSLDGTLRIWTIKGICENILSGHISTKMINLKEVIISVATDNTIRVWNQKEELILTGHTNTINDIAILPNNQLISVSQDKTQMVWNVETGKCIRIIGEAYTPINYVIIWNNKVVVDWGTELFIYK